MKRPKTITEWVNEYVTRRRMLDSSQKNLNETTSHPLRYQASDKLLRFLEGL